MLAVETAPLVEVTRGEIVESIHFGAFCVVNREGQVLASAGALELMTYPRSSLKPFQALAFIEHGGAEHFGFFGEEIAIMCGSHTGTALHQAVLEGMHEKIGTSGADLACGVHWPIDSETRNELKLAGETPRVFHHNCSGKHTGMLAYARLRGFSKDDYLNPEHPVQVSIRKTVAEFLDMEPDEMPLGIDGCSAPVYGVPMVKMAHGVAKLADPINFSPERQKACQTITSAMMAYPFMVAGTGQLDTDLMIVGGGKLFSKGGAEGYQIIGVPPGVLAEGSQGLGIAIKISDGDPRGRARNLVSLTILHALGVLDERDIKRLGQHGNTQVKNWRDVVIGEMVPAFSLPDLSSVVIL